MSLEDELLKQRLSRIREIEALGYRPYGGRYEFTHTVPQILADYGPKTAEELAPQVRVRVAGRLMAIPTLADIPESAGSSGSTSG